MLCESAGCSSVCPVSAGAITGSAAAGDVTASAGDVTGTGTSSGGNTTAWSGDVTGGPGVAGMAVGGTDDVIWLTAAAGSGCPVTAVSADTSLLLCYKHL